MKTMMLSLVAFAMMCMVLIANNQMTLMAAVLATVGGAAWAVLAYLETDPTASEGVQDGE